MWSINYRKEEECVDNKNFHTMKGYQMESKNEITNSMEDYLEMICRISEEGKAVRIKLLASKINVKPSSATKMVGNLRDLGFVIYEKYGIIKPTEKGWELGKYLLYRHETIHKFLCMLNKSDCELEQTEQIEHFINRKTIENMEKLMKSITTHDTLRHTPKS